MTETITSGFVFKNIILIESIFKRISNIDFEQKIVPTVEIGTEHVEKGAELFCTIKMSYSASYENDANEPKVIEAEIVFIGVFEKVGDELLPLNDFATVNAPSIIFPFVREHFASVTSKAGVNTILLPPVNFVVLAQSKIK